MSEDLTPVMWVPPGVNEEEVLRQLKDIGERRGAAPRMQFVLTIYGTDELTAEDILRDEVKDDVAGALGVLRKDLHNQVLNVAHTTLHYRSLDTEE